MVESVHVAAARSAAQPRLAATTLVVRENSGKIEVLMLLRSAQSSFMPATHVFPGGGVDGRDAELLGTIDEADFMLPSRLMLGGTTPGVAVAALRECFEECGLWLGVDIDPGEAGAALRARLSDARQRLLRNQTDLKAIADDLGLPLVTSVLQPWSHWITPIGVAKRFDTRFFIAPLPKGQLAEVDAAETTALSWWHPQDALGRHREGAFDLPFATRRTLEELTAYTCLDELLRAAARPRPIEPRHPRVSRRHDGTRQPVLAEHPAYAEVCKLDPDGHGRAFSTIAAGMPVEIASGVLRVTAPNPGPMTGPGTNTYVLDCGDGSVVVLDPGPALDVHLDAVNAACNGRELRAVLVTHTHADHSPAAACLPAGVPRIGLAPPAAGRQDRSFQPNHQPADGEVFCWGKLQLQALHTPGHASNQLCWWLEDQCLLFTGDHLMQGSTVVIDPPDGDMAAYLASLNGLSTRLPALAWLAPGHGFLMDRPLQRIAALLAHRAAREDKVVLALKDIGRPTASVDVLLARVYDDVPPQLHPAARRSLLAHLLKLQREGRVAEDAGIGWKLL
jgi:glyoxylase-like metal-dependent hydrolase (beta-lactamase superfamily II)/8-oxo-dGTP pyrophosphatase MutT (NUDIX family)